MNFSKTKLVGYLLILLAVVKAAIDALDGSGFDISAHFNEVALALSGAGLVFLRGAISKVENK